MFFLEDELNKRILQLKLKNNLPFPIDSNIHHCTLSEVKAGRDNVLPHIHDYIELTYVLDKQCFYTSGNASHTLHKNDYIISDYKTIHKYDFCESDDFTILNIMFKPVFIDPSLIKCKRLTEIARFHLINYNYIDKSNSITTSVFHDSDEEKILKLFLSLHSELSKTSPSYEIVRCYLIILLIEILRSNYSRLQDNYSEITKNVISFINENYNNVITLSECCNRMSYSMPYVSSVFKNETKLSFRDYLKETRMEHACNLLKNTNKAVSQIAYELSYLDIHRFQMHFKQTYGVSPSEFRKLR